MVPAGDVLPRFPVVISPDRSPPVVEPKERHVGAMVQRKAHAEEARRGPRGVHDQGPGRVEVAEHGERGAALVPQLAARLHDAWEAGDYPAAFAAQHRANAFAAVFRPLHGFLHAAGKAVLSRLDLMEKWVAPPKTAMSDEEADGAFAAVKEFLPEFERS